MGYRSNVMALIYPEPGGAEAAEYEQLKVLMGTTFKHVSDEFGGCMTWHDKEFVLKFNLEDVKWYPSYADVKMFHEMFDTFQCEEIGGYCTEFIRIGEENDDVAETRSGENNQYYLSVRRSIDCNV